MFKTPDITSAQLVTIVTAVIAVVLAAGLDISVALQSAIIGLVAVVGGVFLYSDATIRKGRAMGSAAKTDAEEKRIFPEE